MNDNKNLVLKKKYLNKKKSITEIFSKIQGEIIYNEDIMRPETEEWEMNINEKENLELD